MWWWSGRGDGFDGSTAANQQCRRASRPKLADQRTRAVGICSAAGAEYPTGERRPFRITAERNPLLFSNE